MPGEVPQRFVVSGHHNRCWIFENTDTGRRPIELEPPADSGCIDFGRAVGIWGDTVLVGATQCSSGGDKPSTGRVFVFERGEAGWTHAATLSADG